MWGYVQPPHLNGRVSIDNINKSGAITEGQIDDSSGEGRVSASPHARAGVTREDSNGVN